MLTVSRAVDGRVFRGDPRSRRGQGWQFAQSRCGAETVGPEVGLAPGTRNPAALAAALLAQPTGRDILQEFVSIG